MDAHEKPPLQEALLTPEYPAPVKEGWGWARQVIIAAGATILLAAGGANLLILRDALATHTCGATRSARLEWEQRQQQIEAAAVEAAAETASAGDAAGTERPAMSNVEQ